MQTIRLLFFAAGLIFVISANSQQRWSLEDCIKYAHENNLYIKRTQLEASIAENNLLHSKMQILPDLNGNASRSYMFGHQVNAQTNEFISANAVSDNFGLSSNLNLFSGLRLYNTIKANEYNTLSKMEDVEKEKIDITFEIASAYLTILFNNELYDVSVNQRDITTLQVARTAKLVEAGSVARGNLLEIKAQLSSEELNVTNARNEVNLSILTLTQILDLDSVSNFLLAEIDSIEPDFTSQIPQVNDIYYESLNYIPHIKSAEYNLKYTEHYLSTQKGAISPSLSLRGSWGTGYSDNYYMPETEILYPYREQLDLSSSTTLSLVLSVPIFNRWETGRNISNAKINVLQSANTLDVVKQQLYKEIQLAHNDAVSAREKYHSAMEAVESYKEAFVYTEQKYNVGIVNSVEYSIAKNNFIKAESELLKAKYEFIFSTKILDFYKGVPITL